MQRQIFIALNHRELYRRRRGDNLAFIGLQLRQTRLNVRCDRENQVFGRHVTVPVVRVGDIADQRIRFILLQRVGSGTNRPGIDILRGAFFQHRIGIFGRQNRRKIHSPVGEERRVRLVQHKLHVIIIDFFDVFDQLIQPNVVEVFVMSLGNIMVRMAGIFLPQHREQHVIGVEITGRLEVFVAVELHALTQGESPGFTVRGDAPFGGQRGNRRIFDRVKVYQAVIKHLGTGDERRARAGNLRVERFRRSFGTIDQRIVARCPGACRRQ